jgi:hypothetical protein
MDFKLKFTTGLVFLLLTYAIAVLEPGSFVVQADVITTVPHMTFILKNSLHHVHT